MIWFQDFLTGHDLQLENISVEERPWGLRGLKTIRYLSVIDIRGSMHCSDSGTQVAGVSMLIPFSKGLESNLTSSHGPGAVMAPGLVSRVCVQS